MTRLEQARNLYLSVFGKEYPVKHRVLILWRSPLSPGDEICKRSGAFEEYAEADIYATFLKSTYEKFDYPFHIYINGETFYQRGDVV